MDQGETIRAFVKRRERLIAIAYTVTWGLFVVFVALSWWDRQRQHRYIRVAVLFVLLIPLLIPTYWLATTKCPTCGFNLLSKRMTKAWKEAAKDACPQCGTSLDEPMVKA